MSSKTCASRPQEQPALSDSARQSNQRRRRAAVQRPRGLAGGAVGHGEAAGDEFAARAAHDGELHGDESEGPAAGASGSTIAAGMLSLAVPRLCFSVVSESECTCSRRMYGTQIPSHESTGLVLVWTH